MAKSTSAICGECGSTINAADPKSFIKIEPGQVWLQCHNECCQHVGRYSLSDLIIKDQVIIIDCPTNLFYDGL
jgi:hypothetical protein